jgi:hypothetical protein
MTEGGGRGRMCFCEENECNAASSIGSGLTNLLATVTFFAILFVRNLRTGASPRN